MKKMLFLLLNMALNPLYTKVLVVPYSMDLTQTSVILNEGGKKGWEVQTTEENDSPSLPIKMILSSFLHFDFIDSVLEEFENDGGIKSIHVLAEKIDSETQEHIIVYGIELYRSLFQLINKWKELSLPEYSIVTTIDFGNLRKEGKRTALIELKLIGRTLLAMN